MFDATDLELARREHAYEMGDDSQSDRAWYRYSDAADAAIVARGWIKPGYPDTHGVDGDEDIDGYSLDGCYDAWEAGTAIDAYVEAVARKRAELGL